MGVVEAILIILALKIPIVGLILWVYMLMKEPADHPDPETVQAKMPPRLPEPGERGPRKRGPHGGQALPLPSPRRDPHPAAAPREAPAMHEEGSTPRETARGPVSPST